MTDDLRRCYFLFVVKNGIPNCVATSFVKNALVRIVSDSGYAHVLVDGVFACIETHKEGKHGGELCFHKRAWFRVYASNPEWGDPSDGVFLQHHDYCPEEYAYTLHQNQSFSHPSFLQYTPSRTGVDKDFENANQP